MKVLRSWPFAIPPGRSYVVDTLPRHVMSDYSYRGLGDYGDDILLIEWDMAVSREDLVRFAELVAERPGEVLVAPYKVYTPTRRLAPLPGGPKWVHRRYVGDKESTRWVTEDDAECDLWGLGLAYLPRAVIEEFLAFWPGHFNDTAISGWHFDRYGPVRIAWDVRPIHLHYLTGDLHG